MELPDADVALVLAGLFEISVVRLEDDALIARVRDVAVRLGGDLEALYYGGSLD